MLTLSLAAASLLTALPAAAQFAKAEDAIQYRQSAFRVLGHHFSRLGGMATWHTPLGETATAQVREAFYRLTDYSPEDIAHVPSAELDVGGRTLHVPRSLKGVAVFSFKRLCGEARGASD